MKIYLIAYGCEPHQGGEHQVGWNPLGDDGDALRLAVKLKMSIDVEERTQHAWSHIVWVAPCFEPLIDDPYAATRRAVVRAAAAIGEAQCHP